MKRSQLDIDGMHDLIIILQRSPHKMAQIHLDNTTSKLHGLQFFRKEPDGFWKIQTSAFNACLNHQTPMNIPFSHEWYQNDPAFHCFKNLVLMECRK